MLFRSSLRELPKTKKSIVNKKPVQPPEIAPPMPKGSQLKKLVKKEPIIFKEKVKPKEPKLNPKKQITKPKPKVEKIQPLPPKKPYIPLFKEKKEKPKKQKKKAPTDWMLQDKSAEIIPDNAIKKSHGASAGKNIQELYGSEFGKLSVGQQKYILDNQEIMRRITQEVLNRQARVSDINNINVNRSNVIEFYLHPNGDMSDFKFLEKSGYFMLDDITRNTIEYAYSRYPRPTEKTLIRYNVFYNLLR